MIRAVSARHDICACAVLSDSSYSPKSRRWKQTIFPTPLPTSREEVLHLSRVLDMLLEEAPSNSSVGVAPPINTSVAEDLSSLAEYFSELPWCGVSRYRQLRCCCADVMVGLRDGVMV